MTGQSMGFASGWDERQPVVLLLDTSGSMGSPVDSPRIDALNSALGTWFDNVRSEARLRARVEVCLIAFDTRIRAYDPAREQLVPVEAEVEPETAGQFFVSVADVQPPLLRANGYSCITVAVETALAIAEQRYETLLRQRLPARRPFIWVLTDGAPSDETGQALAADDLAPVARRLRRSEEAGTCVFQAIGVQGADREMLEVLAPEGTSMLADLDFGRILDHLFTSSDKVDAARPVRETHEEIARRAEQLRRFKELEEGVL